MERFAVAELPQELVREVISKNIEEILKYIPISRPGYPRKQKEEPLHKVKYEKAYYSWFYLWAKRYTWYWALKKDCDTETGCTQEKPSCEMHADVHQEHPAWDNLHKRYVSLLFTASCANPQCGFFNLQSNYDTFPEQHGWYFCGVDFYPCFVDCIGQRFAVEGQAVVVYWPYYSSD